MSPSSLEPSPLQPAQDMQTRPAVPTALLHLCPLVNSWSTEGTPLPQKGQGSFPSYGGSAQRLASTQVLGKHLPVDPPQTPR